MINYILPSDCSLVPPKEKWGFTVWKMWTKHYNFYMNRKCTLRTWVPMISWMAAHVSLLVSSGPSFSDFRWPIFEIYLDRNICNVHHWHFFLSIDFMLCKEYQCHMKYAVILHAGPLYLGHISPLTVLSYDIQIYITNVSQ